MSDSGDDGILFYDDVYLEDLVDLSAEEFNVAGFDYLADADGDGVGNLNEEFAGTDPLDASSAPGDVEVDVVAPYDSGFAELFEDDPYTRIRHVMTVADEVYRRSGTGVRLRLVGIPLLGAGEPLLDEHLDEYAADIRVDFSAPPYASVCGSAGLPGGSRGFIPSYGRARNAIVFSNCGGTTAAHEIGHVMGLGHSYQQDSTGVWRWSRGHYIDYGSSLGTVMSYGGSASPRFSDPNVVCRGASSFGPCGVDRNELEGADAVASLNAVRFTVAHYAEGKADTDSDSFIDDRDAFPSDPGEWRDTDGDGVGNVADTDDDGDGANDDVDAFPLDPSEAADSDNDGVGDNADAFPTEPSETEDTDGDGVGDNRDQYPTDPSESRDTDGDGVGDNGDPFPNDPYEWSDADGDGIGDNSDSDADGDGVANALDLFPADSTKTDLSSYLIRAEAARDGIGKGVLFGAGDMDQDGTPDFVIGAPQHQGRGAIYTTSGAHLAAADAADGVRDRIVNLRHVLAQEGSWKFLGHSKRSQYGGWGEAVAIGDWNGDSRADMAIAGVLPPTAEREHTPAVYIVDGASFASLDAADGIVDSVIDLSHVTDNASSWLLLGEEHHRGFRVGVAIARDIDGSGPRVIVGLSAYGAERRREIYVVSSLGLAAADTADGERDGVVHLRGTVGSHGSWRLVDDDAGGHFIPGGTVASGDFDGDGFDDVILGGSPVGWAARRFYVISGHQLPGADLADGEMDGVVELSRVTDGSGSWSLVDEHRYTCCGEWATVHMDADGSRTLVLGDERRSYIVSNADIGAVDAADGSADGSVLLANVSAQPSSFETLPVRGLGDIDGDGARDFAVFEGSISHSVRFGPSPTDAEAGHWAMVSGASEEFGTSASSAGDIDGDGRSDVLLGKPYGTVGEVLLLMAADFAALDRADGASDRTLLESNLTLLDNDHDGLANTVDLDDDNDGFADHFDDFPLDPNEWKDSDGDGEGDNSDAFPRDRNEIRDTDGDGVGNVADTDDDNDGIPDGEDDLPYDTDNDGVNNWDDSDDDNDGVADADDELPLDPQETKDTDSDGIGNNADSDDDNDGVADAADDLPLDPTETRDADGDGVGDNADAYPNDDTEWADFDGDGVGDNADADDDNDGVPDSADAFPLDPDESADSDGDGVGNNADLFPSDPDETVDFDGDGVGDNGDADDDNDGEKDIDDLFPRNRAKSALTSYELAHTVAASYLNSVRGIASLAGDEGTLVMGTPAAGAVYAVPVGLMPAADVLDGRSDGHVKLDRMVALSRSWKITGVVGLAATDVNGDSSVDLLTSLRRHHRSVYAGTRYVVIYPDVVASADGTDGTVDGVIDVKFALDESQAEVLVTTGHDLAVLSDLDGDGLADFSLSNESLLGGGGTGEVYLALATALHDGHVTWSLEGEYTGDKAGAAVVAAGNSHILVGAPRHDVLLGNEGAVYLVPIAGISASTLPVADLNVLSRDDDRFGLKSVPNMDGGWKLLGDSTRHPIGRNLSTGDVDGDDLADILIGRFGGPDLLVSRASLPDADEEDGIVDGIVDIRYVTGLPNNYEFAGEDLDGYALRGWVSTIVNDLDNDGVPDLLFSGAKPPLYDLNRLYIVSGAQLGAADAADEDIDGRIALASLVEQPGTWVLDLGRLNLYTAQGVGDLDGDGFPDLTIAADSAFFISGTDLPILDATDGIRDRVVDLNTLGVR